MARAKYQHIYEGLRYDPPQPQWYEMVYPTPELTRLEVKERKPKSPDDGMRWHHAQRGLDIVMTDYFHVNGYFIDQGHSASWHRLDPGWYEEEGSFSGWPTSVAGVEQFKKFCSRPEVNSGLVTAVNAKAKEAGLDLLTTLAEAPETIKLLMDVFRAVRNPIQNAHKAIQASRRLGKWVDTASQTWLLYRYGIMPLYYTAKDYMSTLERQALFQTSRGKDLKEYDVVIGENPIIPGWSFDVEFETVFHVKETERVTIKNCYTDESFKRKYGINPALTAWELVPFSFVVDWFIQVGDFIQALAPSLHTYQGAVYSRKLEVTASTRIKSGESPRDNAPQAHADDSLTYTHNVLGVLCKLEAYHRVVINPDSHITIPTDVSYNWKRAVDSFALTWSIMRSQFDSIRKDLKNGQVQFERTSTKGRYRRKRK